MYDHSRSMRGIARRTSKDYNKNIASIKEEPIKYQELGWTKGSLAERKYLGSVMATF